MTRRLLVLFVLAGVVVAPPAGLPPRSVASAATPGCGHERWSVKVMADSAVGRVNMTPVRATVEDLASRSVPGGRIGPDDPRLPEETQAYVVAAGFREAKQETDLDYHLVIVGASGQTMIAEIPDPSCVSPRIRSAVADARRAADAMIGHPPSDTRFTPVPGTPQVEVTGVLFFDVRHRIPQRGVAPNDAELHPVLNLRSVAR